MTQLLYCKTVRWFKYWIVSCVKYYIVRWFKYCIGMPLMTQVLHCKVSFFSSIDWSDVSCLKHFIVRCLMTDVTPSLLTEPGPSSRAWSTSWTSTRWTAARCRLSCRTQPWARTWGGRPAASRRELYSVSQWPQKRRHGALPRWSGARRLLLTCGTTDWEPCTVSGRQRGQSLVTRLFIEYSQQFQRRNWLERNGDSCLISLVFHLI